MSRFIACLLLALSVAISAAVAADPSPILIDRLMADKAGKIPARNVSGQIEMLSLDDFPAVPFPVLGYDTDSDTAQVQTKKGIYWLAPSFFSISQKASVATKCEAAEKFAHAGAAGPTWRSSEHQQTVTRNMSDCP